MVRIENGQLMVENPESVERRIRARCRKSMGRSLAEELIIERREEARREVEPRERSAGSVRAPCNQQGEPGSGS